MQMRTALTVLALVLLVADIALALVWFTMDRPARAQRSPATLASSPRTRVLVASDATIRATDATDATGATEPTHAEKVRRHLRTATRGSRR